MRRLPTTLRIFSPGEPTTSHLTSTSDNGTICRCSAVSLEPFVFVLVEHQDRLRVGLYFLIYG